MSFYDLLTERYGIEIVGGIQTIEPTVTNEEESEILGVPLHSPAFQFERTTRSETGTIVEFVRSIYRGDRYRLVTELNRRDRATAVPVFMPREQGAMSTAAGPSPEPAIPAIPGAQLLAEIREQPEALRRLLGHADEYAAAAAEAAGAKARSRPDGGARLVGQRSVVRRLRVRDAAGLDRDARLDLALGLLRRAGRSDRLLRDRACPSPVRRRTCSTTSPGRGPGAASRSPSRTSPSSSLAAAAEVVLPLAAGPELAVAATKTYTNQLAALALLAGYAAGRGPEVVEGIHRTADLLDELLPVLERRVSELAVSLAFVGRMFVIGRGPEFATAREISLKLLETCRVAAEPLTATDLVHGPVAAIDAFFPVWTIASADESLPAVREAAARARAAGAS